MKTLILCASKYGTTRYCAEQIAKHIKGGAEVLQIQRGIAPDLSAYDTIVLGTPIYITKPRKELTAFIKQHMAVLETKRVGLFMCCIQDSEKSVTEQFALAFPQALRGRAFAMALMGGQIDHKKLRFVDRLIMKMVAAGLDKPEMAKALSTLDETRFERFAQIIEGAE